MIDWILFLDDMRFPDDVQKHIGAHKKIIICRSIDDAKWCVKNYGLPSAIHFDHDMTTQHYGQDYSDGKTGLHFAVWFAAHVEEQCFILPNGFEFGIHSMNEDRGQLIRGVMLNLIERFRS